MKLNELKPAPGATRDRKRVGRGPGSGHGKTAGRGHKGQLSRSGAKHRPWFEGGQMPINRRVPKRGFHNKFRRVFQVVNVRDLERLPEGVEANLDTLYEHGLVGKRLQPVKLLGDGELNRAVTVRVDKCSAKAREIVEAAGGTVETVL
ncbi:MAG: 50S ribosomal protein L15 [Candidatus Krumholzibacteriota bacterium]|nr:50S ribosomal protein L15 [Candidatus Krumholzibacteriota bacterium]